MQANIFLEKIPISNETKEILRKIKKRFLGIFILFGGEDYELLFSLKPNKNLKDIKKKFYKNRITFSNGSGVKDL